MGAAAGAARWVGPVIAIAAAAGCGCASGAECDGCADACYEVRALAGAEDDFGSFDRASFTLDDGGTARRTYPFNAGTVRFETCASETDVAVELVVRDRAGFEYATVGGGPEVVAQFDVPPGTTLLTEVTLRDPSPAGPVEVLVVKSSRDATGES
jgi:hypothetical protein